MKSDGETIEMFASYDPTESFRAAAEIAGCSHRTVAKMSLPVTRACRSLRLFARAWSPMRFAQDRGMDRSFKGRDPRQQGPRQARRFGLWRFGAFNPAGDRPSACSMAARTPEGASSVDHRAGPLAAI